MCGIVTKCTLVTNCRHFYCTDCIDGITIEYDGFAICPLDDNRLFSDSLCKVEGNDALNRSRVRCPNAGHGCEYTGYLQEAGEHFRGCRFQPVPCSNCGSTYGYSDFVYHRLHC
uniref:Uncharacterized protein n=1 Tax=Ixodes scapularis TaxID=6945 RepID=A0A1S4M652_IXOSC